ncbi:MAG: methyl-accepting chemotaxis protein [Pseudomonadota bacterium]
MRVPGLSWIKNSKLNSVLVKSSLIAALMTLCVVVTMAAVNGEGKRTLMVEVKAERASDVTNLLAMQSGGAIKFGNEVAVTDTIEGVLNNAGASMLGAFVLNTNGVTLYETEGVNMQSAEALEVAQAALESGQQVQSANGLIVASPAIFGQDNAVAGVIVTRWIYDQAFSELRKIENMSLVFGVGVFLVAMLGNCFFLWHMMSRPLDRVGETMNEIAQKEYDLFVPHTERSDEIGLIAMRLDELRARLKKARGMQREAAFKSAAFEGSSAAMMMVDENAQVSFVNPKCAALLESLLPALRSNWPGAEAENWIGTDISQFHALAEITGHLSEDGKFAESAVSVRVGERDIQIRVNPALDHKSRPIGAVVEWSDVTVQQRNAAILTGIDTSQMRLDFAQSGACLAMNSVARNRLGFDEDSAAQATLLELLGDTQATETPTEGVASSVLSGDPGHQKLSLMAGTVNEVVLDASFVPVRSLDGALERVILLGSDVTEIDKERRESREQMAKVAKEQGIVVDALGSALKRLSQGNLENELTDAFPSDYQQLRTHFNVTVASLREAVGTVTQNVASIRNETVEITTAADDLSRRTERQAATLEQTAAALDELTTSVRSAADGADAASQMSADAQANAEQGGAIAHQAVQAMDEIKTSSQQISKITSVIDDIAFQTNLLALSAGVEAARAGEAGRGFAVVATEVRALAQRSSEAAREINALISASSDQVREGVDLVDRTGSALSAIVSSVSDISTRVSEIAISAREQSAGLNEINVAVNELDHVTQQNAAMFEETTAASHALTSETDALASAVSKFKLGKSYEVPAKTAPHVKTSPVSVPTIPVATHGNAALAYDTDAASPDTGWEEF